MASSGIWAGPPFVCGWDVGARGVVLVCRARRGRWWHWGGTFVVVVVGAIVIVIVIVIIVFVILIDDFVVVEGDR